MTRLDPPASSPTTIRTIGMSAAPTMTRGSATVTSIAGIRRTTTTILLTPSDPPTTTPPETTLEVPTT